MRQSININQYDILFELLDQCRQIVYNHNTEPNSPVDLTYIENLIKEFDGAK